MPDKEIIKRDRERAQIYRAAMELVRDVFNEEHAAGGNGDRADALYDLLEEMKRNEYRMYCDEVYFDGYQQPMTDADWDW